MQSNAVLEWFELVEWLSAACRVSHSVQTSRPRVAFRLFCLAGSPIADCGLPAAGPEPTDAPMR